MRNSLITNSFVIQRNWFTLPYQTTMIMKRNDNTLTKAEFDVMSIMWDINHSVCIHDILDHYEDPKPAYTTVATYMKILHEKGYVDFFKVKGEGKKQMFVAKVTRAEYTKRTMDNVKKDFFGNNLKSMFSYFVSEEQLSREEIRELLNMIEKDKV